ALMISQSVPTSMNPGQSYSVSVSMKNTGTSTWSALGGIKFGSQNPPDNVTWGTSGIPLNKSITPGSTYTFLLGVTAPITPGAYNFQWQMFRTGAGYFGVPTTNVAIQVGGGGGGGTNGAAFVSQSVPSSMTAGQVTGVSVTMNNNGSTT